MPSAPSRRPHDPSTGTLPPPQRKEGPARELGPASRGSSGSLTAVDLFAFPPARPSPRPNSPHALSPSSCWTVPLPSSLPKPGTLRPGLPSHWACLLSHFLCGCEGKALYSGEVACRKPGRGKPSRNRYQYVMLSELLHKLIPPAGGTGPLGVLPGSAPTGRVPVPSPRPTGAEGVTRRDHRPRPLGVQDDGGLGAGESILENLLNPKAAPSCSFPLSFLFSFLPFFSPFSFSLKRVDSCGIRCAKFQCSLRLAFWPSFLFLSFALGRTPTVCRAVRQAPLGTRS